MTTWIIFPLKLNGDFNLWEMDCGPHKLALGFGKSLEWLTRSSARSCPSAVPPPPGPLLSTLEMAAVQLQGPPGKKGGQVNLPEVPGVCLFGPKASED